MIFKIFRKTIEKVRWRITGNWNEISGNSKKRKKEKTRNKSKFNKSELFDSFPSFFRVIRSIIHVVRYKNQVRCTRSRWKASKLPRIQHSSAYVYCIERTCATQRYCMLIKFHKPYSMHKQLRHKSRAREKKLETGAMCICWVSPHNITGNGYDGGQHLIYSLQLLHGTLRHTSSGCT
jgi:hypothetical protein